jgi:ankyrin repeat protein
MNLGGAMKKAIVAICFLTVVTALMAQEKSGTIIGKVVDEDANPLPGVVVDVLDSSSAKVASTVTKPDGMFRLSSVPPGTYTVVFELMGFETYKREGIDLHANWTVSVDAVLEQATLEESPIIEVKSNKPIYRAPFIRGEKAEVMDKEGLTPLHGAAEVEREAARLIAAGADVNARTFDGWTPLHFAAYAGCLEVVELLLSKGAAVNPEDENGWTPLHSAGVHDSDDVAELLLLRGASVHSMTVDGWTPLHAALENGSEDVAGLLIARGANVKAKTESGMTPLHFAVQSHCDDTAKLLIGKGADINARDRDGRTPLHLAAGSDFPDDLVELLLAHGATVKARTETKETPLHFAALTGDEEVAGLLIDKGADVNARDRDGRTPLHVAVTGVLAADIVELLLNRGADPRAKTASGKTPLHFVAMNEDENEEVAELLIGRGANVNAKDRDGRTPLSLAEEAGHADLAALLKKHGAQK